MCLIGEGINKKQIMLKKERFLLSEVGLNNKRTNSSADLNSIIKLFYKNLNIYAVNQVR